MNLVQMVDITLPLTAGYVLDILFGDPGLLYHPVRIIGNAISTGEKVIRKIVPDSGAYAGGVLLTLVITSLSFLLPFVLLKNVAHFWGPGFYIALDAFLCFRLLAAKSLKDESMRVYEQLEKGDLVSAKRYLSWIVGRDTEPLDERGVIKATVETVAENTSDGVIAPLMFMAFGGAPLGFFYKAVNTLDSMIGYKNDRYINFGRFAAKLDDVVNFIPARVSALFMLVSGMLLGFDYKNGCNIFIRDRKNHASPNSAQTESVCAGLLDIQLGGNAWYFGNMVEKPHIGDNLRPVENADIKRSNQLMLLSSFIGVISFLLIKAGIYRLLIG